MNPMSKFQFTERTRTALRRLCVVAGLLLGATVGSCNGLGNLECSGDDPGCDVSLLLLQFFTSGNRIVPEEFYQATSNSEIEIFTIDATTGALSFSRTIPFGANLNSVKIDAVNSVLHTGGAGAAGGIRSFDISESGQATAFPGTPLNTDSASDLTMLPSGNMVYGRTGSSINAVLVDQNTKSHTTASGSPFGTGCVVEILVGNEGNTLYFSGGFINLKSNSFSIDQTTGAITQSSEITQGNLGDLVQHPDGAFLYGALSSNSAGQLYAYTTDSASGAITGSISGSPYVGSVFGGGNAAFAALAMDSSGAYLYASSTVASFQSVSAFAIDQTTGVLTELSTSPVIVGEATEQIQVSPDDKYLYLSMGDGTKRIRQYEIQADGSLVFVADYAIQSNTAARGFDIDFRTEPRF